MTILDDENPSNAEQVRFWNEVSGPLWVELQAEMDLHTAGFGDPALERASLQPGEKVLDVGCGCGGTTVAIAAMVAPLGEVLGIDVSSVMLARARERIDDAGHENADLLVADAQVADLPRNYFDVAFSRFGVMFFADPPRAFSNIASSLREGGRITFVCWQAPDKNPWMTIPMRAAFSALSNPLPAPVDAPGPFFLSDPARTSMILESAGFEDVEITALERDSLLTDSDNLDRWAHYRILMGPCREQYESATDEVRGRVREAVVNSVSEFLTPEGVSMPGAAWIVEALRR